MRRDAVARRLESADHRNVSALAQPLIDHRDEIARLCRAYGVDRLEVFGSAADGRFDPVRSDFDFIVRFASGDGDSLARRFLGLAEALESLLGRRVDLMTDHAIENPYLRRSVEATRRSLYVEPTAEASA